jgi:NADH:ubiquinone oxidoreductase subunit F (NADH-binding)
VTAVPEDQEKQRPDAQAGLPRLLPPPEDKQASHALASHTARHGRLPYRDREGVLIKDIGTSGLTGRDGGAFPVYRKLDAVLSAAEKRRRTAKVIANGAESEPASDKDATLLWLAPHLVLDGLQLAAEAVAADAAFLYIHTNRERDVGARLAEAIRERQARGLDRVPVQLAQAPDRFLSGQETALLNHLAGGAAVPRFMPPRITERGLDNAPTLVQNVETLAHLALIARKGPRWFRSCGTSDEPGSMLATVRRRDGKPRISEVPLGMSLAALTGELPAGSAVLIGGYHGTWLSAADAQRLTLDNASLAAVQARVGAGVVAVLPPDRCGLVETARVVRYLALESAGQCGPCLNALPRIAAALAEVAGGRFHAGTLEDVQRWANLAAGRGACHHPDGTVRFVDSALQVFAPELARHARGRCSAPNGKPFLPVPQTTARTETDWI